MFFLYNEKENEKNDEFKVERGRGSRIRDYKLLFNIILKKPFEMWLIFIKIKFVLIIFIKAIVFTVFKKQFSVIFFRNYLVLGNFFKFERFFLN